MNENYNLLIDFGVNLFFAILGFALAIWYDRLGSPRLLFIPEDTTDGIKTNGWRTRFLHIGVINSPKKVPFLRRQTAFSVHGTISFFTMDDKQVGKTMPIKWDGTPEPIKFEVVEGEIVAIVDPQLVRISRFIDIPPDEKESLAIAVRIYDDKSAYGWTSESYFRGWRHPDFALPIGKYIAKVRLTTGDAIFEKEFQFNNLYKFQNFDLIRENAG